MSADPAERVHGGPQEAELAAAGVRAGDVLDFSVNLNPYGPAADMVAAIRGAALAPYPDSSARAAREVVATASGVTPAQVVVGAGAADLLWTAVRALLAPGDAFLSIEPTFSEARAAAVHAHLAVHEWRARAEDGFALDRAAIVDAARRAGARAVYLCTPGNPTGVRAPLGLVRALAEDLPRTHLLLDESFLALSDGHADAAAPLPANVVRVRSITKEHTIAGVRAGYLLARPEVCARIESARPAWSTGAAAQAAVRASTRLAGFVADCRAHLSADRRALEDDLRTLGLSPLPSSTCFTLVPVPGATALRARLLARHAVLVRDCASFGLPDFLRLAARPAVQRRRLIAALRAEL